MHLRCRVAVVLLQLGLAASDAMQPFEVLFSVTSLAPSKAGGEEEASEGSFVVRITPAWAPLGAERFHEMVEAHFLDGCAFFRVIGGFMAQFGINGDPAVDRPWNRKTITDDPAHPGVGNTRGRLTFATSGKNSRTTQLFINFGDNGFLDKMGFTPFGEVISGMDVVDRIFVAGESKPQGPGPEPGLIQRRGNEYLQAEFPKLTKMSVRPLVVSDPVPASSSITTTLVTCELTVGSITIEVHPEWAPIGAKRFLDLVAVGFFDNCALFRALKNFLVQFGISANPQLREEWRRLPPLQDDPLRPDIPIKFGTMAYAGSGQNSRSTQMWIALDGPHGSLGTQFWETPFAQVVGQESLAALARINTEYGDDVQQGKIWNDDEYLAQSFPRLDRIKQCRVTPPGAATGLSAKASAGEAASSDPAGLAQGQASGQVQQQPGKGGAPLAAGVGLDTSIMVALASMLTAALCLVVFVRCRRHTSKEQEPDGRDV